MLNHARSILVALLTLAALPLVAGPPWLSIEYPANPHDARTREAFLFVNTYHHGTPAAMRLTGTAEGIVDGERRSIALRFGDTERRGSYAVTRQWPREGRWVLSITLRTGERADASALVVLGADGTPSRVTMPTRRDGPWHVPRLLTAAEVTTALGEAGEQAQD